MRHNPNIRAGGLAHPDGTITINADEKSPNTTLHEVRHQVVRAQGWRGFGEVDEAFADAKSEDEHNKLVEMRATEWRKSYGKFDAGRYLKAMRLIRFFEQRYGTNTAVKLVKILDPNISAIRTTVMMRFAGRKNKR